jgi:N-acetylglutamate synthase-like GNAT family acetyltransferase
MIEGLSPESVPAGGWAVRRARAAEWPGILALLRDLELEYPAMDPSCFYVGGSGGEVVAVAELKEGADHSLLSCVGVRESLQGSGLGRALVAEVLRDARHDVYLYTLVPGFFARCGFSPAAATPPGLPGRQLYGCVGCDPARCICMVRKRDASPVS